MPLQAVVLRGEPAAPRRPASSRSRASVARLVPVEAGMIGGLEIEVKGIAEGRDVRGRPVAGAEGPEGRDAHPGEPRRGPQEPLARGRRGALESQPEAEHGCRVPRFPLRRARDQIRQQGLFKEEWPILGEQGPEIRVEGRETPVLNFCANNYLGLSGHPELIAAAHRALDQWGYGLSSVRFICGTQALHLELEKRVAEFLGMEDAILYAACFDANGGVFEPLLSADDAIVTDQLNHASIIDGVRLCKAKRYVYAQLRHGGPRGEARRRPRPSASA